LAAIFLRARLLGRLDEIRERHPPNSQAVWTADELEAVDKWIREAPGRPMFSVGWAFIRLRLALSQSRRNEEGNQ
jgi:hypothetical protein